ncbi:hypothetical protein AB1N83_006039 [Pleurotus pulmonarius]
MIVPNTSVFLRYRVCFRARIRISNVWVRCISDARYARPGSFKWGTWAFGVFDFSHPCDFLHPPPWQDKLVTVVLLVE